MIQQTRLKSHVMRLMFVAILVEFVVLAVLLSGRLLPADSESASLPTFVPLSTQLAKPVLSPTDAPDSDIALAAPNSAQPLDAAPAVVNVPASFAPDQQQEPTPAFEINSSDDRVQVDPAVTAALAASPEVQVIISLRDANSGQVLTTQSADQIAQAQAAALSGIPSSAFQVTGQFSQIAALSGTVTAEGLAALQAQGLVASIYLDRPTRIHMSDAKPLLGADRVATDFGFTGKDVIVAILDTGVDATHPALADSIIAQKCFAANGGCQGSDESNDATDDNGHGTHVTGIITAPDGIAPDAEIVAVRVVGKNGSGLTSDWIRALDWILANQATLNVDIINMSLGSGDLEPGTCDAEFARFFPPGKAAIDRLTALGVTIFASSGNQGSTDAIEAPACLSSVISVGATYDSNLGREPDTGNYETIIPCADEITGPRVLACFTNRSSKLDVLAPGAVITSTHLGGGTAAYAGTSQAAPMAAGVAALMLEADPTLIASQIRDRMRASGTSVTGTQAPFIDAFATIQALTANFCVGVTEIPRAECHALVDLYNYTNGLNWFVNTGWLQTNTPCSWFGVTCAGGQVIRIGLNDNRLSGTIPDSIGSFSELKQLELGLNNLSGSIPVEVGNLPNLSVLILLGNPLTGTIPSELGNLTNLRDLYLHTTQLEGSIPATLGNLANLEYLYLHNNNLTGSIPPELGNLTNLVYMSLNNNSITGNIPPELSNLNNLEFLILSANHLEGSIPPQLANLTNLVELYLSVNQLTGIIPPELGNLSNLRIFTVAINRLTGSIPSELGDLANLERVSLTDNLLTGTIPPELGSLSNLLELLLSNNRLSGPIPSELGRLTNIENLFLQNNQLGGEIPVELAQISSNLSILDLGFNTLAATDPALRTFLNQYDPDWESTQTLSPTINTIAPTSPNTMRVSWTPRGDTTSPGYYEVWSRPSIGPAIQLVGQTTNQTDTSLLINGLTANTSYDFQVRRITLPSVQQQNQLVSEFSAFASGVTAVTGCAGVTEIPVSQCEALEAVYNTMGGPGWTQNTGWMQSGSTFQVVSGGSDSTLRLWDSATGQEIGNPWIGHNGFVYSVAFSPDGSQVVSGSGSQSDRMLILWDAATGQQIGDPWVGHTSFVYSVAFSPDGSQVVSGSWDSTLRLWDAATGQQIGVPWIGHESVIYTVAFSPDGSRVVSGSLDGTIRLWDVATGQQIGNPWIDVSNPVGSLAFSPDGTRVVSGLADSTLRLWDAVTGQQIAEPWIGHTDYVYSVAFSPDGSRLISASADRTLRLWEVATGEQIGTPWEGHTESVRSAQYNRDGTRIVSGSNDQTLRLWNAETGQPIGQPWQTLEDVWDIAVSLVDLPSFFQPCTWYGVTCTNGNVTRLALPANNLIGALPAALADLPQLQSLDLSGNQITGALPAELGALDALTTLRLSNNQITGTLPPQIGDMSSLQVLDHSNNQISGGIPAEFAQLGDTLTYLRLDSNLLGQALSDVWSAFTNLQILSVAGNAFTGEIPASVTGMTALVRADFGYNALVATDPTVRQFLTERAPDWWKTQIAPPSNIRVLPITPSNGLPGVQASTSGVDVVWDAPTYTERLAGYTLTYTVDGKPTSIDVPLEPRRVSIIGLTPSDIVSVTMRSRALPDTYQFPSPIVIFPCDLQSPRDPLNGLPLPPGADGEITFPQDGNCTMPTNPTGVVFTGTITPELASKSIYPLVYTPTEVEPKYYPQGRVDAVCGNPRGVDLDGLNWTSDVFFGREGVPEEFHVVLAAVDPGSEADEIFKQWLRDGCLRQRQDPTDQCVFPGFLLEADDPGSLCTHQVMPSAISEVDAIRIHTTNPAPVGGMQRNVLTSVDSAPAVEAEAPAEVEIDILDFKAEIVIQPGEGTDPDGPLPSCGFDVNGRFVGSFPRGRFVGSFPRSANIRFIARSPDFAPVMAVYVREPDGSLREVACKASGGEVGQPSANAVVDPAQSEVVIELSIDQDYEVYVWANFGGSGTLLFNAEPTQPYELVPSREGVKAALDGKNPDEETPPGQRPEPFCGFTDTQAYGRFVGTFPTSKFAAYFPGSEKADFTISVITNEIRPIVGVFEAIRDNAGNIQRGPQIACQSAPRVENLVFPITLDLNKEYLIEIKGVRQLPVDQIDQEGGAFILRIEPTAYEIDQLPFELDASIINIETDNPNQQAVPDICGTEDVSRFRMRFDTKRFQEVFSGGETEFHLNIETTAFAPVIEIHDITDPVGTSTACHVAQAVGSLEIPTQTFVYGRVYEIILSGDYGTTGAFTFTMTPLEQPVEYVAGDFPYIVKSTLNMTDETLIPSCAPNSTGWFRVSVPGSELNLRDGREELQFGVETYSFTPVVVVYTNTGGVLTEVFCGVLETPGLLRLRYTYESTQNYLILVRSLGGSGTDFEFGIGNIPQLITPQTELYCPTTTTTQELTVIGLGRNHLEGQVSVSYATSPTDRPSVPNGLYPIDYWGPQDFKLAVALPSVYDWPVFSVPEIPYPVSALVISADLNVELADQRSIARLGSNPSWVLYCLHNISPSADQITSDDLQAKLLTFLTAGIEIQPTPTLLPTATLLPDVTATPEVTVTPEETTEVSPTPEATELPTDTTTPTDTATPTVEPTATPEPTLTELPTMTPTVETPPAPPVPPTVEVTSEPDSRPTETSP